MRVASYGERSGSGEEGMRVLVGCEESQVVCSAFRARGHEAYSCDLVPTRGEHPEWHIQMDVRHLLEPERTISIFTDELRRIDIPCKWDLGIFFVPCTNLAVSGARWFPQKRADRSQRQAIEFFLDCYNANIPRIAIENPINIVCGKKTYLKRWFPDLYEKAKVLPESQIIQPWMFGHMEQKATCLWLKGLPPLKETNNVYDAMMKLSERERQRMHYMSPSPNRARDRSVTYRGVADAMAEQWE